MSANSNSQRATASSTSPYPRRNWWGEDVDGTETTGHDPETYDYERQRARWLAHNLLKETGRLACPITLNAAPYNPPELWTWLESGDPYTVVDHDPTAIHTENEVIDLPDPDSWLPKQTRERYGPRPLEYGQDITRANPRHGYPTGPQILDRPADEFMRLCRTLLEHFETVLGLSSREREKLANYAKGLKHDPEWRDVDILERVVYEATSEGAILAD